MTTRYDAQARIHKKLSPLIPHLQLMRTRFVVIIVPPLACYTPCLLRTLPQNLIFLKFFPNCNMLFSLSLYNTYLTFQRWIKGNMGISKLLISFSHPRRAHMSLSSPIICMQLYIHFAYNSKLCLHIYSTEDKFLDHK